MARVIFTAAVGLLALTFCVSIAVAKEYPIGKPQVALKLPFSFPVFYNNGNAYDFSPDLSTIVYARPGGQADFYLLTLQ